MDIELQNKSYWNDLDSRLEELLDKGFVKFPTIKPFDLDDVDKKISDEIKGNTFFEACNSHKNFLDKLNLNDFLVPKLFQIAKSNFGFKGEIDDQYHIARRVEPGNSKEMYRAHFDSHIFTMVIPIKIPNSSSSGSSGDLIFHPNSRENPNSEIVNILSKAYHKRYASKDGLEKFGKNHTQLVDNFTDYRPLLFIGNTTLHTNKPVSLCCDSHRLTLLAHFFDSSSKYGIGSLLRLIRNR